jgi:hypothetical protein
MGYEYNDIKKIRTIDIPQLSGYKIKQQEAETFDETDKQNIIDIHTRYDKLSLTELKQNYELVRNALPDETATLLQKKYEKLTNEQEQRAFMKRFIAPMELVTTKLGHAKERYDNACYKTLVTEPNITIEERIPLESFSYIEQRMIGLVRAESQGTVPADPNFIRTVSYLNASPLMINQMIDRARTNTGGYSENDLAQHIALEYENARADTTVNEVGNVINRIDHLVRWFPTVQENTSLKRILIDQAAGNKSNFTDQEQLRMAITKVYNELSSNHPAGTLLREAFNISNHETDSLRSSAFETIRTTIPVKQEHALNPERILYSIQNDLQQGKQLSPEQAGAAAYILTIASQLKEQAATLNKSLEQSSQAQIQNAIEFNGRDTAYRTGILANKIYNSDQHIDVFRMSTNDILSPVNLAQTTWKRLAARSHQFNAVTQQLHSALTQNIA